MALHNLIESSSCEHVDVLRSDYMAENNLCKIDTSDLVPGDILVIPRNGCVLPCDAVMLTGICIVNESSLTGESVPITKTPPHPSQEIYKTSTHRRHTLFAGKELIALKSRFPALIRRQLQQNRTVNCGDTIFLVSVENRRRCRETER